MESNESEAKMTGVEKQAGIVLNFSVNPGAPSALCHAHFGDSLRAVGYCRGGDQFFHFAVWFSKNLAGDSD
jgi:hypothetical protein